MIEAVLTSISQWNRQINWVGLQAVKHKLSGLVRGPSNFRAGATSYVDHAVILVKQNNETYLKGQKNDWRNSKTQRKRTKNHVIDKLQDADTDKGTNHNQVKAASLKEDKRRMLPLQSGQGGLFTESMFVDIDYRMLIINLFYYMAQSACCWYNMHTDALSASPGGGGGGGIPYKKGKGRDARRLAKGYKFRILVSLRVIWAKRNHM